MVTIIQTLLCLVNNVLFYVEFRLLIHITKKETCLLKINIIYQLVNIFYNNHGVVFS